MSAWHHDLCTSDGSSAVPVFATYPQDFSVLSVSRCSFQASMIEKVQHSDSYGCLIS